MEILYSEKKKITRSEFESIVQSLKDKKKGTNGWYNGCCPAHEDSNASFGIKYLEEFETVAVKCFRGCSREDILSQLNLDAFDYTNFINTYLDAPKKKKTSKEDFWKNAQLEDSYDYYYPDGSYAYQVLKFRDYTTGEKSFVQRHKSQDGSWVKGLEGIKKTLYNVLPLIDVELSGKPVFIPEGEGCVDVLKSLGLVAVTNSSGALSWIQSYNDFFKDRIVIILPDNDFTGEERTRILVKNLTGVAAKIKIVHLEGLPEKGDVVDFFELNGDGAFLKFKEQVQSTPYLDVSLTYEDAQGEIDDNLTSLETLQSKQYQDDNFEDVELQEKFELKIKELENICSGKSLEDLLLTDICLDCNAPKNTEYGFFVENKKVKAVFDETDEKTYYPVIIKCFHGAKPLEIPVFNAKTEKNDNFEESDAPEFFDLSAF